MAGQSRNSSGSRAALAAFGTFAFRRRDLFEILSEAARICAASLGVPFCKICRYRKQENDLLIVAGAGWHDGVIGLVVSQADESSPQGRAYVTGEPVIIRNINEANNLALPGFYPEHGIISTVDVLIPASEGAAPMGCWRSTVRSSTCTTGTTSIFLTGFANVLAEAVAAVTRDQALRDLLREEEPAGRGTAAPGAKQPADDQQHADGLCPQRSR